MLDVGSIAQRERENTRLQTSHVAPLRDVVTAVSALRWRTFWLNMAALMGGKEATLRCKNDVNY